MPDDGRLVERADERRKVGNRERVHDRGAVVEGELHDHQARRVGSLGVKLGVERDARSRRRARRARAVRPRHRRRYVGSFTASAWPFGAAGKWKCGRWCSAVDVRVRCSIVAVQRNGRHAVAEDREQRADRNGDRAHRPHVHPERNLERRGGRGRDRSAEPGNHAHREQERRRADRKALDPRAAGGARYSSRSSSDEARAVDPIAEHRREHQADRVHDGARDRPEDRAVHDRERVGHRKRRRGDEREDGDGQRIGERRRASGSRARRAAGSE